MSRRTAIVCADETCRSGSRRTELGHLYGAVLELKAGVRASPVPGGADIACPVCGAVKRFRGKVVMVVSELAQAC